MPEKRRHAPTRAGGSFGAWSSLADSLWARRARAESFWQLLPAAGSSCSGGSSPGPVFDLVDGGTYYPSN